APASKPLRFDLTPLIGYRTSVSALLQPDVQGSDAKVVFDASPSYGLAFGVRLDEESLIEFRWARDDTHFHLENTSQLFTKGRAVLDQFHGDFTREYLFDDYPWARPYVIGSMGATHISASNTTGFTRFSFGLGGGVKFFANRHVGLRVQAEWLPILVEPQVGAFVCGGGCVVHLGGQLSSQGEVTIGPVFRF